MRRRIIAATLGIGWATLLGSASGADFGPVTLHGFVSQSFLQTSDNIYLGLESTDGTWAYTEEALNFTVNPTPKLRIGAQLVGRDLGPQGNHKVFMDWALGDYRFVDEIGIRAGRMKLPVGLYNNVFDADMARPEILQPDSLYPQNQRDFRNTVEGVQVYGTLRLGGAGFLDYEGWSGTMDLDEAFVVPRYMSDGALQLLPALQASGLQNASYVLNQSNGRLDTTFGGILEWRPPVAGLRLKGSVGEATAHFSSVVTYSGSFGPLPVSIPVRTDLRLRERYDLYFSAEYQRGGLRISAEHLRGDTRIENTIDGLPGTGPITTYLTKEPRSSYAQVAYRFNPHFQASTYYSVYYPDAQDKDGQQLALTGQPDFRAWQKDWTLTGRVDINNHWLFKAEFHVIDGTAALNLSDNPGGFKKDWNMFIARTTLYF
jgi:hypothetical protein